MLLIFYCFVIVVSFSVLACGDVNRHYVSVFTLPPKFPIDNVGLGPASQDSRTLKNGLLFCYCYFV